LQHHVKYAPGIEHLEETDSDPILNYLLNELDSQEISNTLIHLIEISCLANSPS